MTDSSKPLDPDLATRIEGALGASILSARPVPRGYTAAKRLVLQLSTGASAFAKIATSKDTAHWLRIEARVYHEIDAEFMPTLLAWIADEEHPVLLLEDLGKADWPPPWTSAQVQILREVLRRVAATRCPDWLPPLEDHRAGLDGWQLVAQDPAPFLALRLCSESWLDRALPRLREEAGKAVLEGDDLIHLDIRSDNVCFQDNRVKLIDWNHVCRGNAEIDVAAWLPSLHAEGGPAPEAVMPDSRGLSTLLSGYWASRAGKPPPPKAPAVRPLQLAQLKTALPWAARELKLPDLDGENS